MADTDAKVLLITGASSGIGAATARAAAQAGWRVALAARSADRLDALVTELGADRAQAIACDVSDWEDQQRMAAGEEGDERVLHHLLLPEDHLADRLAHAVQLLAERLDLGDEGGGILAGGRVLHRGAGHFNHA